MRFISRKSVTFEFVKENCPMEERKVSVDMIKEEMYEFVEYMSRDFSQT
jgi:hypothetical protein